MTRSLRQKIVSGQFGPCGKLPSQLDLVREFGVSTVTIQRAMDRLAEDGFVVRRPRQGVFVDPSPPHLADYCLIFTERHESLALGNRFLHSLNRVASGLAAAGTRRVSAYHEVIPEPPSRSYRDAVDRVTNHRTAGIVFLTNPVRFAGTPLLTEPGVPRVAIMGGEAIPGLTPVRLGPSMPMVLEWLAGQGCRRLALVTVPQTTEPEIAAWADAASSRGLALSRPRVLAVPTDAPRWAQHAVQALMDRPAAERPDGLVVTDDNLVPSASAGLLASGVRVPDECRLAAHGNFPWATECFVPAMRFGPDTRQVMRACMDAIDQARRGRPMPDRIVIPVIQDERQAADAVLQEQEGART